MNANNIESKFAAMGARIKLREIASHWLQGDRAWVSPADFAVDIRRDNAGEFFELRVPTHLRDTLDVSVIQAEPKQRHLLLFVRKQGENLKLSPEPRFLKLWFSDQQFDLGSFSEVTLFDEWNNVIPLGAGGSMSAAA